MHFALNNCRFYVIYQQTSIRTSWGEKHRNKKKMIAICYVHKFVGLNCVDGFNSKICVHKLNVSIYFLYLQKCKNVLLFFFSKCEQFFAFIFPYRLNQIASALICFPIYNSTDCHLVVECVIKLRNLLLRNLNFFLGKIRWRMKATKKLYKAIWNDILSRLMTVAINFEANFQCQLCIRVASV